ncbi:alpha/beta hydrolase [Colletotrichum tofieldiae]|uniref:Alpha/beta hydrolase n=1 Tax=Colletotrichum tofieldiae TaxID=708197 RepID=A0A166YVX7_9PEZI|nr:alpha/beta hydrolase [Colletotrichum tofieldiae]GKT57651.1 alpha/beta hydrolase [Colletotrichum tofieldiae]GKT77215.1 alpha/beta hydrolase [Colletotrichum tofieldiae]GKT86396.1 alpha/beta hydrolase [Colletotrichum tofieldiae]
MHFNALLAAVALTGSVSGLAVRQTTPRWETLPATPSLPSPISTAKTPVNGIQMWFQKYNEKAGGIPIVMDHGGLGYSAYFGSVITRLINAGHYVIAVDRRGHGRSTYNKNDVFTYDQMALDIYALLQGAGVTTYNLVGWSDGGITTLSALINPVTAKPINKAFLFGASANPEQTNATFSDTAIFATFVARCRTEYATLQPGANFTDFGTKVATMEATLPQFTDAQLKSINGAKVMIAGADHEEAVNRDVPGILNKAIPGSKVTILTGVSHFAPLQDPDQFTKVVTDFFKA